MWPFSWMKKRLKGLRSCPKETIAASLLPHMYDAKCGHGTYLRGTIGPEDDRREITLTLESDNRPEVCLDCIEKAIIRCAWCGDTIWPNDPITLYAAMNKEFVPKEGSRKYDDDGSSAVYVGCLGWDCAKTGADRAGFWRIPVQVERHQTPLEQCAASNEMVIVPDHSKP